MMITDLNHMESIVGSNPNLFWEGWSVCTYIKEDGFYSNNGVYKDGEWLKKRVFEYSKDGWNIPDRFIKNV